MTSVPVRVEIFSRPNCHLCDEAKAAIERVRKRTRLGFDLNVVNIETDPKLEREFGTDIPVVFVNGQKAFKYRVDEIEFEKRLKRLWKT